MAEDIMRPETVLVVDDEQAVCVSLQGVLARAGYRTFAANDGPTALKIMAEHPIDLVLLDLNMPVMSGLELMHIIHERWPLTVILILTGYGTLESALSALRHGAHDYLLKPSIPEDIIASIRKGLDKRRTILRRSKLLTRIEQSVHELAKEDPDVTSSTSVLEPDTRVEESRLRAGDLIIDLQQHRVILDDRQIVLTPTEFNVLVVLVRNSGRVLSYATIVKSTHGYECSEQEARMLIKTHISHLRRKIERHSKEPCPIVNVRGVGYMWSNAQEP